MYISLVGFYMFYIFITIMIRILFLLPSRLTLVYWKAVDLFFFRFIFFFQTIQSFMDIFPFLRGILLAILTFKFLQRGTFQSVSKCVSQS